MTPAPLRRQLVGPLVEDDDRRAAGRGAGVVGSQLGQGGVAVRG